MSSVLIVDDEKLFLQSLSEGLTSAVDEISFITAENGQEAIEILDSQKIDLVVTDLQMPIMDGYQLLLYITNSHQKLPVIIMTAFGNIETEKLLNSYSSVKYIEKPVDFQMLLNLIQESLSNETGGHLTGIDLVSFIQLLQQQGNTCAVKTYSKNATLGMLYFENGELVHAETSELSGEEAFYEIISWSNPEIGIESISYKEERTLNSPLHQLLFDAVRLKDEKIHDTERLFIKKASETESTLEEALKEDLKEALKEDLKEDLKENIEEEQEKTLPENVATLNIETSGQKKEKTMEESLVSTINQIEGVDLAISFNTRGELIETTTEKDSKLIEFISFLGGIIHKLDDTLNLGKTNTIILTGKHEHSISVFIRNGYYLGVQISNNLPLREINNQIKNYLR